MKRYLTEVLDFTRKIIFFQNTCIDLKDCVYDDFFCSVDLRHFLLLEIWQYTDLFQDDHSNTVLLKGGSAYRPSGSSWYYPQVQGLKDHEKYFLMDDGYERAGKGKKFI